LAGAARRGAFALALASAALGCSSRGCGAGGPATEAGPASRASASASIDAALRDRLQAAVAARGPSYVPRTRHQGPDGAPKYTNRLALESSPYLLQHAHNPVDWFPWGDEAFARARALGRPVFLSIGYSTCHWCHVMEEESFEDEAIARQLNDTYVCIKVDREERPDVDAVYMAFVQGLTGGGGWPMSVWLTPAREPFFGGTYFPPRAGARGARRGFTELLAAEAGRFAADPIAVAAEASGFVGKLRAAAAPEPAGDYPGVAPLEAARADAARRFDPVAGGSRGAPKFPSSFPTRLLLRFARRADDEAARRMATETLDQMRAGGIYDQIGGGFHRYSTDARWLVPHFEKMLYDNALLALSYLEAEQAAGGGRYASTARATLDYLAREMQAPDGTFYSATDADSPTAAGHLAEGAFFTWTPAELREALGAEGGRVAQAWFGVSDAGQLEGRSVLHEGRPLADVARELGLGPPALAERVASSRPRLLERRAARPPPPRDDKAIVAWNGLAISAFARAALALGDAPYGETALRAARALVMPLRRGEALPHVVLGGRPQGRGFADDYALLALALLDVFELTSDPVWLDDAAALLEELERSFVDPAQGGYYASAAHHEGLLLRDKPERDGPTPSANSAAALAWLRLFSLTDDERYRVRAEATLRAFARPLGSRPLALDQMLLGLDWATDAVKEIVVVVPEGRGAFAPAARPLLDALGRRFVPNAVLVVASEADLEGELGRRIPWGRGKRLHAGRARAYVCERGTCKAPTSDPAAFAAQLAEARPYR
jgi:hypothetical protein